MLNAYSDTVKTKIYTLQDYLSENHRKRIFPLLFDWFFAKNEKTLKHFELTDKASDADLLILPVDLNFFYTEKRERELNDFLDLATKYKKNLWLYSGGDFGISLPFNAYVHTFRLGGFASKLTQNTYILPSFVNEAYSKILKTDFNTLGKDDKPNVGFVGHADGSFFKWTKELIIFIKQTIARVLRKSRTDFQSFYPSSIKRFKYLKMIESNRNVKSNFIYRSKYRAGSNSSTEKEKTTFEFFKNIEENLYTFCLRGSGNFSVRFYETLMMGRIPLLIDTDVRLPLHDEIDWKNHCVIANSENFLNELVRFHNEKTEEELKQIQINNRELMQTKLDRVDYFIHMANKIGR